MRRQSHFECLETSAAISSCFYPNYIAPTEALVALQGVGVRGVLVGSHGLGGWRQSPRAAREATILVSARSHRKAVRALLSTFPRLRPGDGNDRAMLHAPEGFEIALPRRLTPLLRRALVNTRRVHAGGRTYHIPSLEMALTLVFADMTGLPWSDPEKYMAAGDFLRILDANPKIALKELAALGEQAYNGGGADLLQTVRHIRAGGKLNL